MNAAEQDSSTTVESEAALCDVNIFLPIRMLSQIQTIMCLQMLLVLILAGESKTVSTKQRVKTKAEKYLERDLLLQNQI